MDFDEFRARVRVILTPEEDDRDGVRLYTVGMYALGSRDLEMREVPPVFALEAVRILNSVGASLIDSAFEAGTFVHLHETNTHLDRLLRLRLEETGNPEVLGLISDPSDLPCDHCSGASGTHFIH